MFVQSAGGHTGRPGGGAEPVAPGFARWKRRARPAQAEGLGVSLVGGLDGLVVGSRVEQVVATSAAGSGQCGGGGDGRHEVMPVTHAGLPSRWRMRSCGLLGGGGDSPVGR